MNLKTGFLVTFHRTLPKESHAIITKEETRVKTRAITRVKTDESVEG